MTQSEPVTRRWRVVDARWNAAALWLLFVGAHAVVAVLAWGVPGDAMHDVYGVYEPWVRDAVTGGTIVGIDERWVYPHLAMLPMLVAGGLAQLLGALLPALGPAVAYAWAWAGLVTILDCVAFALLMGRPSSSIVLLTVHRRHAAALVWALSFAALGPVGMYRIDAIAVPLAVMASLALVRHPVLAGVLFAVGAWIKIWPGAVALAAVAVLRDRWRVLVGAVSVTGAVMLAIVGIGGGSHLLGFVADQGERGLQIESVAATPFLWLAARGQAEIHFSFEILTFEVTGPGTAAASALLNPLLIVAVAAIVAVAIVCAKRSGDATALVAPTALALVAALIVANKVGSPQFHTWLVVPTMMVVALRTPGYRMLAAMVITATALTFVIYPLSYAWLTAAVPWAVAIVTLRNLLLVAVLAVAVRGIHATYRQAL
ncbi:hypothetical protein [Microbacterium sp. YY-01]|uniref:hypothetical protein n=1 Tax=Microbacterium sp. YY-01 TaxID=3421634 RepID=UPI003D16D004